MVDHYRAGQAKDLDFANICTLSYNIVRSTKRTTCLRGFPIILAPSTPRSSRTSHLRHVELEVGQTNIDLNLGLLAAVDIEGLLPLLLHFEGRRAHALRI